MANRFRMNLQGIEEDIEQITMSIRLEHTDKNFLLAQHQHLQKNQKQEII